MFCIIRGLYGKCSSMPGFIERLGWPKEKLVIAGYFVYTTVMFGGVLGVSI